MLKVFRDARGHTRSMNNDETVELAGYLNVDPESLERPFLVKDKHCPKCSRHITFLDFVKTAVDHGGHEIDALRQVLTGQNGSWLTICGKDGGRPQACASRGNVLSNSGTSYPSYSDGHYATVKRRIILEASGLIELRLEAASRCCCAAS